MFHLDNNSGVSAMPPLGAVQRSAPRWFTEGGGGVPASYPGAAWFNMIQAELLNLCAAYGISPDKANLNQLKLAIEAAVNQRAPLASPAFSGVPTAPTASQSTNNTQIATTAFVKAALAALVDSSPAALDTLNELAAALGNDPNFATTMTNALAGKQPLDNTLTALSGKDVAGILSYLGLGNLPNFGSAASKDVGTTAGTVAAGDDSRIVNAVQPSNPALCTAWVNFNGVAPATIKSSHNVSSITRLSTGKYTINFTSPMAGIDYCPVLSAGDGSSAGSASAVIMLDATNPATGRAMKTVDGFTMYLRSTAGGYDSTELNAVIYGGK